MERFRRVEMVVPHRIVTVPVLVGLGIDRCAMLVSVMLVMTMNVGVLDGFVTMPVAMRLTDESPHPEADEQSPHHQAASRRISEHGDAGDGADKRRDGEQSGDPRGPETPERQHVEDQACPVRDHAHDRRGYDRCNTGQMDAERERSRDVHGASSQTLRRRHRQRVEVRHFAREIVVERPAETGERYEAEPERIHRPVRRRHRRGSAKGRQREPLPSATPNLLAEEPSRG